MMMLAGQSNPLWHYAAGKYPGKVGLLMGPSYYKKQSLKPWMPYVLDNDAFTLRDQWPEDKWYEMIEWARGCQYQPMWVLVPDVVSSRLGTLERWAKYSPAVKRCGWPMAFAVQDGMTPADIPADADVVFVGGSTEWKWSCLGQWLDFPRVHVGRVNAIEKVWHCDDAGVESVDGTGWFRDPSRADKLPALHDWMRGIRHNNNQQQLVLETK